MAFRPVFILNGGERGTNSQVFDTEKEALDSARDRFMRWTAPTGFTAEQCDGPVNYVRVDGRDKRKEN
jgi:hypothetical protein